ncbi:YcnI family protein [Amycolatopsis suaedae]|uniref:DUF1775 domain-containing protein n=1 Tax=Amycolatopsis suaedae TaxID=2510978 RepID=A0A4Q7J5Z8_9PSEU|nr:YcnI family protein [Amycolatopsis suaedae]RZQ62162.1 DUF1775 domain-containing protein [Amycolatopsis suaedae]
MSTSTTLRRAAVLVGVAGMTTLLGGGIAAAHVTANVYGAEPTKGGYGAFVLRVPNEEPDAGTTKVEVSFPAEYALTSARTRPLPGWTAKVEKVKLPTPVKNSKGADVAEVVSKISWTAQPGVKIAAGSTEFQEFEVVVGSLPNVDTLVIPAAQTYENGKVVNWDAPPPPAGGEEPEHPAPTVKLAASTGDGHGHGETKADGDHAQAASAGTDNTARWLGGAGLAVGALGLGIGAGATLRARKLAAPKDNA